jgi:hypothetical protein
MSTLDDIFGSPIVTPEEQMRLRAPEGECRTAMREQAADETRKADQADNLEAALTRAEIDQKNRSYAYRDSSGGVQWREP